MPDVSSVNLLDLFETTTGVAAGRIFSDGCFSRHKGFLVDDENIKVTYIVDYVSEHKMASVHLEIDFKSDNIVDLFLGSGQCKKTPYGTFVDCNDSDIAFWFPGQIVARDYYPNGNIQKEQNVPAKQSQSDGFHLSIHGQKGLTVEIPVLLISSGKEQFYAEIENFNAIEARNVKLPLYFEYDHFAQVWDYLFSGKIFHTSRYSYDREIDIRWPCPQTANALYFYMTYLHAMTGKNIYRFVYALIAYSLMLDLDDDGRWRQGIWSEANETHLRAQVNGVCLLSHYYKQTGCEDFLNKSRDAMDYVISLADPMQGDQLWFVHDSLEQEQFHDKSRYRNDLISEVSGNSPWNSVTLNTHMWTMIGMDRFKELTGDSRYEEYIQRGLVPLKRVMEAKPANMIYGMVYSLRDSLNRWQDSGRFNRIARNIASRYEKLLRSTLLPYLKKKYPRLNMPTGFIERDLLHSFVSDNYHIITLRDMLALYVYHPCQWLKEMITASMVYSHKSGFIKHFAKTDPRSISFIDMLMLYSNMIDESYLKLVPEYLSYFKKMGYPVSSTALSEVGIINDSIRIHTDNVSLTVLTVRQSRQLVGIVANCQDQNCQAIIKTEFPEGRDFDLEITDSNGCEVTLDGPVEVGRLGYIKFSKKEFGPI